MKSFSLPFLLLALLSTTAFAADVETRISPRETYVGRPVVLRLSISNATRYQEPTLPTIDGCDIRLAEPPREMSQITIINGRRDARRSVMMTYLITPRHEGSFTVPAMTLQVDGETLTTEPQRFIATKSETGELMFAEIEGGKKQVFVGEPLDLVLKIWMKPFRDPSTGQTLSEGDMWKTITNSTSWGGFTDRMKELASHRQRPGGEEVLRDDGNGQERSYYQYRIHATVYPKRAGQIDADDVQIVANYPVELGRSRSPFPGALADDFFGSRSPLSRMMDDDFFGSPFGDRMTIMQSRPIVADASVDAAEVLPIPTAGRPDDYRGAVGQYQMITQATPTSVDAGDPITLHIRIQGTGPMELVQAPPLATMSELTKEFKVPDEPLAGFVKDDIKVFSTTIRPRHAGIDGIPPIRFSFFNPETQEFETVFSDPIAITVNQSETLALDAIISNAPGGSPGGLQATMDSGLPDFTNHGGASVLLNQSRRAAVDWWWAFVIVPPLVWLGVVVWKNWGVIAARMPSFRAPKTRCLTAIDRAEDHDDINHAITAFILKRTGAAAAVAPTDAAVPPTDRASTDPASADPASTDPATKERVTRERATQAVGELRLAGMYQIAEEVESLMSPSHSIAPRPLEETAAVAKSLVDRIDTAIQSSKKHGVPRRKPGRISSSATGTSTKSPLHRTAGLLLLATSLSGLAATPAAAQATEALDPVATDVTIDAAGADVTMNPLALSPAQQATLLAEATDAYERGVAKSKSDSAEAKALLATARSKYRMLVDSGIRNAELYINLANADLQTGELGHAIASYEQALLLDPSNAQARRNLAFAETKVTRGSPPADSTIGLRSINDRVVDIIGSQTVIWILALSSIVFWGLLVLGVIHRTFSFWKSAAAPLALLLISFSSVLLTETNPRFPWNAVIVANSVKIHAGDGEQFDAVVTLDAAQGHRVEVLDHRGNWTQVRTVEGHTGWVQDRDVQIVSTASRSTDRGVDGHTPNENLPEQNDAVSA